MDSPNSLSGPAAPRPAGGRAPLFASALLGGFECSCHRTADGRRLDMQETTRHRELADGDYARLRSVGIVAARDGIPWVLAERAAGRYAFSAFAPLVAAAARHRVDVVWDLMHFGWPDGIDVFAPSFPARFGRYAAALARFVAAESPGPQFFAPVNEMSFLAWAGGDVRVMFPFEAARGVELKTALVRATIEAIEAIRGVLPRARFVQPEPIIHIVANPEHWKTHRRVESDNLLQFQAWDMLTGRVWPALGGREDYLDIVGVNFYSDNQFTPEGETVRPGDARYRPLSRMLVETWRRYGRPMFVSETGAEGDARAPWLRYVADECVAAMREGCELHGVTLYPIVSYPGWTDGRRCENGLWDYADERGHRAPEPLLLAEVRRQEPRLYAERRRVLTRGGVRDLAVGA